MLDPRQIDDIVSKVRNKERRTWQDYESEGGEDLVNLMLAIDSFYHMKMVDIYFNVNGNSQVEGEEGSLQYEIAQLTFRETFKEMRSRKNMYLLLASDVKSKLAKWVAGNEKDWEDDESIFRKRLRILTQFPDEILYLIDHYTLHEAGDTVGISGEIPRPIKHQDDWVVIPPRIYRERYSERESSKNA